MKKMNLVQKLPIGLSLACMMMMTSCSQEDVQTPEPEAAAPRTEASLRGIGGGILILQPELATTNAVWGNDRYADKWERYTYPGSGNPLMYPSGTSSLKSLWGDDSKPFVKALPEIPGIADMRGILTVTTNSIVADVIPGVSNATSVAKSTIKNLKPGQKYQIKYYVACAVPAQNAQGKIPVFAEKANVRLQYNASGKTQFSGNYGITSLAGKHAEWVAQTIIFTAEDTEVDFIFSSAVKNPGNYSYVHMYVDKNSMKKVN
ncbi:hypothetical protein [Dyadobacter bucti]|uniref:hypothetical protein n=1 Tax=Dyadobacter bucti TaxID=2572203 RepID=UPI00140AD42A|nr:hypothetical protein [Dyadobacter bucti]